MSIKLWARFIRLATQISEPQKRDVPFKIEYVDDIAIAVKKLAALPGEHLSCVSRDGSKMIIWTPEDGHVEGSCSLPIRPVQLEFDLAA